MKWITGTLIGIYALSAILFFTSNVTATNAENNDSLTTPEIVVSQEITPLK